jgi:hypothetical protein
MTLYQAIYRLGEIATNNFVKANSESEAADILLQWYPEADIVCVFAYVDPSSQQQDFHLLN